MIPILTVSHVGKSFTLHLHQGRTLPVVAGVSFCVNPAECVVLGGPSGAGKSSILKMIYGNYAIDSGSVIVEGEDGPIDVATAAPKQIIALRQHTMGYVSQFLRVIPRVPALEIVASAARDCGIARDEAEARARDLLTGLNLPESLWGLPPSTFSGGEQQRVNIARGFAGTHKLLILDEPTASLDAKNREAVVGLIAERKRQGAAFLGIFHDEDVRERVADRIIDVRGFAARKAA